MNKFRYDYGSIPQPTSKYAKDNMAQTVKNLNRAVESIPYYVGKTDHFVVLTPPTRHNDTGKICDTMVYKWRGWCRLEMLAWNLLSGGKPTIVIDGPRTLTKMNISSIFGSPKIGKGGFTCCDRFDNHTVEDASGVKTQIACDKGKIGPVLSSLLDRATVCHKEVGNAHMYRFIKAMRRVPLEGLLNVDDRFESQPTTWAEFCKEFDLNEAYPMHLSKKQLRELNCVQPLVYAVCSLNVHIVKLILAGGGKANTVVGVSKDLQGFNFCLSICGWNVLHFAALACSAEYPNDSSSILKLLTGARGNPYKWGTSGQSPIAVSIHCQNMFFIRWMMNNYSGFRINKYIDTNDHTIVSIGCYAGNLKLVQEAFDAGATFNTRMILGGALPAIFLCGSGFDSSHQDNPVDILKWFLDNNIIRHVNDVRNDTRKIRVGQKFDLIITVR